MPRRKRKIAWPAWVDRLQDGCLRASVKEALDARDFAVGHGALARTRSACARVFQSAEETLDAVEFGRVVGDAACRRAAVAARKFNTAGECARPTASRDGTRRSP